MLDGGCKVEQAGHPLLEGCPALVLDAASPTLFAGILSLVDGRAQWLKTLSTDAGAVEHLLPSVQTALAASGLDLESLRGLVICEGPGNLLGLRTAVIAGETWRAIEVNPHWQLWSYSSLDLIQQNLGADFPELREADVLMDWRRGHWFRCRLRGGQWLAVDTLAAADFAQAQMADKVFHIQGRGNWPGPALPTQPLRYDPSRFIDWLASGATGIQSVSQFEVRGEPVKEYVRWSGLRHGA